MSQTQRDARTCTTCDMQCLSAKHRRAHEKTCKTRMKARIEPTLLYNKEHGFPVWLDIARYIRLLPDMLTGSRHYNERRAQKHLPRQVGKDWVECAELIEIQVSRIDNAVLRYVVRGGGVLKMKDGSVRDVALGDLALVIDAATGEMVTGWWNHPANQHENLSDEYKRRVTPVG